MNRSLITGVGAVGVLLLAFCVAWEFAIQRTATVTLYNGFTSAVTVRMGDEQHLVAAQSPLTVEVPPSELEVETSFVGGEVFESVTVDLSDLGRGYTLYNIGNRAILYRDFVVYESVTAGLAPTDPPSAQRVSDPVTNWIGVDYWFTEPPEYKETTADQVVNDVMLAVGQDEDPLTVARWLLSEGDEAGAQRFARSVMREGDGRYEMVAIAARAITAPDGPDFDEWCDGIIEEAPEQIHRHRVCQDIVGRHERHLQTEYEGLLAQHPQSALHHYLLARVHTDKAQARRLRDRAIELDPEFAYAYLARGYQTMASNGVLADALADYQRAGRLQPSTLEQSLRARLILMQVLGRPFAEQIAAAEEVDPSVLGLGTWIRIREGIEVVPEPVPRMQRELADDDPRVLASYLASVKLAQGDFAGVREENGRGAEFRLQLALADSATPADRSYIPPVQSDTVRLGILAIALAMQENRDPQAHLDWVGRLFPDLPALFSHGPPSLEEVQGVLADVPPTEHGVVWFALFRAYDNPEFGDRASLWLLPDEVAPFVVTAP